MFSIRSIILALAATSASAQCVRNATVGEGDTCDAISIKYASSTYQLALSNPNINDGCSNLDVGDSICLGVKGEDCQKIYQVVANDTCDLISSTYGLTNTTLYLNNPQINNDCSNIYVGEVLCVDTTIYPYSSSSAYYNNADATGSATFDYGGSGTATGSAQGAAPTTSDSTDDEDLPYCD